MHICATSKAIDTGLDQQLRDQQFPSAPPYRDHGRIVLTLLVSIIGVYLCELTLIVFMWHPQKGLLRVRGLARLQA